MHPQELFHHTLGDLHGAHQGMKKMQAKAREAVYWPGIHANNKDYICRCTICTKHKASLPAQPMLPQDIPNGPWQEITADSFHHKGKEYLLIWNLFSKYPSCPKSHPNLPIPSPKSYRNSSPSMDHPATYTPAMALPLHLMNSHSSCSNNTLTIPPLCHIFPT